MALYLLVLPPKEARIAARGSGTAAVFPLLVVCFPTICDDSSGCLQNNNMGRPSLWKHRGIAGFEWVDSFETD